MSDAPRMNEPGGTSRSSIPLASWRTRQREAEEDGACHFPFQTGLRFSTNAFGPSTKSSLFTIRSTAG